MKNYLLLFCLLGFVACKNKPSENQTVSLDSVASTNLDNKNSAIVMASNELAGVKLGDDLAELLKRSPSPIKKSVLQTGEGDFLVYDIYDATNEKIGYLFPDLKTEKKVESIVLTSPKIQTPGGIKVGATYGDLIKIYGKIEVNGSEIEGWTHATGKEFSYKLDTNIWNFDIDESKINLATKIVEIQTN